MRLLNTSSLILEDFPGEERPEYAILSHRWEDEEVSYQDFQSARGPQMLGFAKIKACCELAKAADIAYVWIDTCCIDKSSSAELSEAINSMFSWYQNSVTCYAYLSDVILSTVEESHFTKSIWFTRGWTLQELLAPTSLTFYDRHWQIIGEKWSLAETLSEATGIERTAIEGWPPSRFPVGQRMAWAAKRVTTRSEDMAYCLMGIFDVNMPLLYGEGRKAFIRLQEEIIKTSDCHSLFAWESGSYIQRGLLASHPDSFARCASLQIKRDKKIRDPFSMTNRGLSITLNLMPWTLNTYLAPLNCALDDPMSKPGRVGIYLQKLAEDDQYTRVKIQGRDLHHFTPYEEIWLHQRDDTRMFQKETVTVRIRQMEVSHLARDLSRPVYGFRLKSENIFQADDSLNPPFEVAGLEWAPDESIISLDPWRSALPGMVRFLDPSRSLQRLGLGFDFDFNPVCFLSSSVQREDPNCQLGQSTIYTAFEQLAHDTNRQMTLSEAEDQDISVELVQTPVSPPESCFLKGHRRYGLKVIIASGLLEGLEIWIRPDLNNRGSKGFKRNIWEVVIDDSSNRKSIAREPVSQPSTLRISIPTTESPTITASSIENTPLPRETTLSRGGFHRKPLPTRSVDSISNPSTDHSSQKASPFDAAPIMQPALDRIDADLTLYLQSLNDGEWVN